MPGGPRYHPAPVYLSLWMLAVLAVLWWVERRYAGRLKPGELFLWFVASLGPGLWLFEAFHADKRLLLPGLSGTQVAALVASLGGLMWIAARHRRSENV